MKLKFIKFLKNYEIYNQFFYNAENIDLDNIQYWTEIINSAFVWSQTDEGWQFWKTKHEMWNEYCHKPLYERKRIEF